MRLQLAQRVPILLVLACFLGGCGSASIVTAGNGGRQPAHSREAVRQEFAAWGEEFQRLRADALPLLLAMNDYSMYLYARAAQHSRQVTDELYWDPPRAPTWTDIRPLLAPLHLRASELHTAVSTSQATDANWRVRRALSEATYHLVLMARDMVSYYEDTNALALTDDGKNTRGQLAGAWRHWTDSGPAGQLAMAPESGSPARLLVQPQQR
jgi:hypothetical protein